MSYYIQGDVLKLDIKIPKSRALEAVGLDEYDGISVSSTTLYFSVDEQTENNSVDLEGEGKDAFFHLTKETIPCIGGNKSNADELLEKLAVMFGGDVEARMSGEDGESWAIKVVQGVKKNVKVMVVEEE